MLAKHCIKVKHFILQETIVMQNALYFENSHVTPVPLLTGVNKKFLQRIISKKKYHTPLLHWKKISTLLVSGKKILPRGNLPPPPPLKSQMVRPLILSGLNLRLCWDRRFSRLMTVLSWSLVASAKDSPLLTTRLSSAMFTTPSIPQRAS